MGTVRGSANEAIAFEGSGSFRLTVDASRPLRARQAHHEVFPFLGQYFTLSPSKGETHTSLSFSGQDVSQSHLRSP